MDKVIENGMEAYDKMIKEETKPVEYRNPMVTLNTLGTPFKKYIEHIFVQADTGHNVDEEWIKFKELVLQQLKLGS